MNRTDHIKLMATYNEWMNVRLYEAAMTLSNEQLSANQKAFFGSLLGTLNHLVVADTIWLKRFTTHPAHFQSLAVMHEHRMPDSLDQVLHTDIRSLWAHRQSLDATILNWANAVTESDLDYVFHYANMKGIESDRNFYSILLHFFNHQTHHRGQATTLLYQYGVDVGVTDLLAIIPDQARQ